MLGMKQIFIPITRTKACKLHSMPSSIDYSSTKQKLPDSIWFDFRFDRYLTIITSIHKLSLLHEMYPIKPISSLAIDSGLHSCLQY